ncbi:AmiS/UreI family transporter [Bacillus sp. FJAT-49732]|uniref:AmiS/UreI family transporter n=1 Tax=Lederbergia citrisecunda TaxID=2833583 RepID=A0A942TUB9_9BACI|nr:AmiS/UreI family transporter [Lederbergia citrisecunda]MBS4202417.1 AmiS/UreI family transporter [Lederbergia citrisecunda]
MQNVGLMYCGAVLFINALMLLGKVDSKSAGVFNLFLGAIQVITPFYVIFTAGSDPWVIFNASGVFLFSLTYLYVGITNLKEWDSSGVGWFSLWVAIMAVGYGIMSFVHFHDPKFGIIWFMWAFLWSLFFLLLALKKDIAILTGWVTLIQALITATIPGFLMLINVWDSIGVELMWGVAVLFAIVVASLFYKTRTSPNKSVVQVTKYSV